METIRSLLELNYTPVLIAARLDTPLEHVVQVMRTLPLAGWGDPKLYGFIVARKRPGESRWLERDLERLALCRARHDAGELSMAQKKDQDYLIQYALPVAGGVPRRLWFTAPAEIY